MSVEGRRDVIAKSIGDLDSALSQARRDGLRIGFVPTLGALHDGHLANIRIAAAESDVVVVSIFLNRLQFDDPKDLARYPGDVATDASSAVRAGAHVVFAPSDVEMFPNGAPEVVVDPGPKGRVLEGASRPGHFSGVATAVTKLLSIVRPRTAYFGEKDYQQLVIVRQLVTDLSIPVTIVSCPTVREDSGLAMSSRNVFLGVNELGGAASLYRSLCEASDEIGRGERDPEKIMKTMAHVIAEDPLLELEYAHVVREGTLDDVKEIDGDVRLLLAVRVGDVRLIDNLLVPAGTLA
jgi:pantoate--beta-alanine ligase